MNGERPLERAAIVVAGSMFPTDKNFRKWLMLRLRRADHALAIASVFALTPHLDHDEDLSDSLMVYCMKLPREAPHDTTRVAIQLALSIWSTSKGSGRCGRCGKTAG